MRVQIKGLWESNINAWSRFMYSQKWNCAPCYFQCSVPQFPIMYTVSVSDIFPGSVCLFCFSQIGRPILGIYKSLTYTWMYELGTRLRSFISGKTWIGLSVQSDYRELSKRRETGRHLQQQRTGTYISVREEISVFSYPFRVRQKLFQGRQNAHIFRSFVEFSCDEKATVCNELKMLDPEA